MSRSLVFHALLAALGLAGISCGGGSSQPINDPIKPTPTGPRAPVAEKRDHAIKSANGTRNDPYFWLRDDSREDPEVLAHLAAENDYTDAMLKPTTALADEIYAEMVGRLKQDDSTVPVLDNGYWYSKRYETGKEYPIIVRKASEDGDEEVLLDQNEAAKGHDYYRAGSIEVSPDNKLMAYAEDTVGRNQYSLRVVDLESGETLADSVSNISSGLAWANDSKTLFYIEKHPTTLLGYRVRRHVIGTEAASDSIAYEERDTSFYLGVSRSKSDAYVFIHLESTLSSETRLLDASKPQSAPTVFRAREPDHQYAVDHFGDFFVIMTNKDAPNWRLVAGQSGDEKTWNELLPHREDAFLHSFDVQNKFIAVSERSGGLRKIRVVLGPGKSFLVEGDETASTMYLSSQPDVTDVVRYSYTSMTTPTTTYELDVATRKKTVLKTEPVLGGFDRDNYVTEWRQATARDGVKIPVSVVYRKGLVKDGSAPLLEYGYGAYGASRDPRFSPTLLSLLDRGFVYANAHVRGGQELGRKWYDDGRVLQKRNSFNDFVDVRDFLVAEKLGAPDKVVALGGSAGGLLVGAVANMAAHKYRAIIAHVPFVDVLTTMLDDKIPLTSNEFDEWGNPADKVHYDYILGYSPYDNVEDRAYPAMLVRTGLWDSQVQYWEPVKWVAKLREHNTGNNPILLHVDMKAGHGGASGRFEKYREIASDYAWLVNTVKMPDPRKQ